MRFAIIALAAAVAASRGFGQTTRVFRLTQNESTQQMDVIADILRGTGDIPQVFIDEQVSSIAVEGTPGQVAMADWLLHQLDLPQNGQYTGVHQYRAAGGDDVLRVLFASHASTPDELQEIASAVQVLAHFQKGFRGYDTLKALVVRGTNQQVSLAAWVVDQLDDPGNAADTSPHDYKVADDDVARVFHPTHARSLEQLQEIATIIRSVGDVSWVIPCNELHAIVMRNKAERVALAAWLVSEFDTPVSRLNVKHGGAAPPEFRLSDDPENLVRVYYLGGSGSASAEAYQKVIDQVRRAARTYRSFVYAALGALVVRGSARQLATAEKVIEQSSAQ